MNQQQTLFPVTIPIGNLPTGSNFTYDGWGAGTITENDGHTHRATIHYHGHQVATLEARNPGELVEVAS